MNARHVATLAFQAPEIQAAKYGYREPASLVKKSVCPTCRKELAVFVVRCDGHAFETYRCRDHGDVPPMRSHIANGE
ncbi:MAG: hypothetical protein LM522_06185 [Candidatus Contendobacter sp.]|nr:hypothetical protein [Candidatus Contendobacter sp.]